MQPQDPNTPQTPPAPTPAPTGAPNQYDFFMNSGPAPAPKSAFSLPSGNSTKTRVMIIAGGLFVLIVAGFILASVLGSGSSSNTAKLTGLIQEQAEIIRVANTAKTEKSVRDVNTLTVASNISLSVKTTQVQVTTMLPKKSQKLNDKVLNLKKNPKTDAALTIAARNNGYDAAFKNYMKAELLKYQAELKSVRANTSKPQNKLILQNAENGVSLLLTDIAK